MRRAHGWTPQVAGEWLEAVTVIERYLGRLSRAAGLSHSIPAFGGFMEHRCVAHFPTVAELAEFTLR